MLRKNLNKWATCGVVKILSWFNSEILAEAIAKRGDSAIVNASLTYYKDGTRIHLHGKHSVLHTVLQDGTRSNTGKPPLPRGVRNNIGDISWNGQNKRKN